MIASSHDDRLVLSQSVPVRNQEAYEAEDIVQNYSTRKGLQKPEQTILELFQNQWAEMNFLDLGVGGGRTTESFAPLVKRYVGADYSEGMIRACRQRFSAAESNVQFLVCDARQLTFAADESFDFVFFSYNGIDYVPHDDRLKILREVRRVLRPKGHFFFSSHNIRCVPGLFRFRIKRHPAKMWARLKKHFLLRRHNPGYAQRMHGPHGIFNDGAQDFTLRTYYVDPREQVVQLEQTGFRDVRKFSVRDGSEIGASNQSLENEEPWLYYLCKAGRSA